MKTLGIFFFACLLFRLLTSVSGYIRTKYYERKYMDYLSHKIDSFTEYTAPIVKLFKEANVDDSSVAVADPVGFGYIRTGNASVFQNMAVLRTDVAAMVQRSFKKAIGTYRSRIIECFSPLFWVKYVLYLPSHILEYIGLDANSVTTKIIQVVYWILTPLLIVCRTELYELIVQLLTQT